MADCFELITKAVKYLTLFGAVISFIIQLNSKLSHGEQGEQQLILLTSNLSTISDKLYEMY